MSAESRTSFITRDRAVIDLLPWVYKWEFTRRHPYYLQHWERARNYSANPQNNPREGASSVSLLHGALTWAGTYPPPDHDGHNDPVLINLQVGASPATVRSLFLQHFITLSRPLRHQLAAILRDEANFGPAEIGGHDDAQYWRKKHA